MTLQGLVTTPFGRRTLSLGLIATQQQARAVEPEKTVHKWKVFQAITEAKDKLGLPDGRLPCSPLCSRSIRRPRSRR